MSARDAGAALRVLGYVRCSTTEQVDSGAGLDAQRAAIAAEAHRRGWAVEYVGDEGYSAKNMRRPGIQRALADLKAGRADVLCVSRLDRLSRSVHDFAGLTATALKERWALVALTWTRRRPRERCSPTSGPPWRSTSGA